MGGRGLRSDQELTDKGGTPEGSTKNSIAGVKNWRREAQRTGDLGEKTQSKGGEVQDR